MFEFNFLLETNTFNHNGLNKEAICSNIERLSLLREEMYSIKESFFRNDDIYYSEIIESKKLYEVLYDDTLDRDSRFMLSKIIDIAKEDSEDIEINANVGLNICEGVECLYTINDWINFHHNNLVNKYENESKFFEGLKRYFPNLEFHQDIKNTLTTLDGGCYNFSNDIILSLKCISTHLKENIENSKNLAEALRKTSSSLGLEITLEGDALRKKNLSFIFKYDKSEKSIYCEAHVKLERSSNSSDSSWYANRIYFHPGIDEIKSRKILIGYIGKHL